MESQTPETNPELFDKVQQGNVQKGDLFQGQKNERKWYVTEGTDIDSWRNYYRRKPVTTGLRPFAPSEPDAGEAEGSAGAAGLPVPQGSLAGAGDPGDADFVVSFKFPRNGLIAQILQKFLSKLD